MEWSRQGRTRARMRMRCASEISASTIYAPMSTDAASSVGLVAPWAYFLVSYMPLACYRGQSSVNSQNACSAAQKGPSGYGPKTCKAAAAVASTADRCPRSRGLHRHNASCTAQRPTPTKERSASDMAEAPALWRRCKALPHRGLAPVRTRENECSERYGGACRCYRPRASMNF